MYETKQTFNFITFQVTNQLPPDIDVQRRIAGHTLVSSAAHFRPPVFRVHAAVGPGLSLSDPTITLSRSPFWHRRDGSHRGRCPDGLWGHSVKF